MNGEWDYSLGVLWFPWILFLSELVLYVFIRKLSRKYMYLIMALSLISAFLLQQFELQYPHYLNVLPSAVFILLLSFVFKSNILAFIKKVPSCRYSLLGGLLLGAPIYTICLKHKMEMAANTFGFDDLFVAFVTSLGMLIVCKAITNNKFMEYLGRNTFLILAIHKLLIDFSVLHIQPLIGNHYFF